MANEYRLSFTAEEIDEKLNKVDNLTWGDIGTDKDGTVTQLDNKYLSILGYQEANLKEFMITVQYMLASKKVVTIEDRSYYVIYALFKNTPKEYPRRYEKIVKSPLKKSMK